MTGSSLPAVYQFKVVLRGISPMVWRRLLLRSDNSIADLHYAIQIAMGWSDSHLNRFRIHAKEYGVAHEGGLTFSDNPERVLAISGYDCASDFSMNMISMINGSTISGWRTCFQPLAIGSFRFAPVAGDWRLRKIVVGHEHLWKTAIRACGSGGTNSHELI